MSTPQLPQPFNIVNLTVTNFTAANSATEDLLLTTNNGETGSGITDPSQFSGNNVNRGTATDFQYGFDETVDKFKIGFVGSLLAVATSEDSPTDARNAVWDASAGYFSTIKSPDQYSVTNGSFTTTFTTAATANYTLNWPVDAGTSGQVLSTNGSGTLSWVANSGGGGSSTFAGLDDTNFTGLVNNQFVRYNSGTTDWENHTLTKSDVGLGNVDNVSSSDILDDSTFTGTTTFSGSFSYSIRNDAASSITLVDSDTWVQSSYAGVTTCALPLTTSNSGRKFIFSRTTDTMQLTISCSGSDTFNNGATTVQLTENGDVIQIVSNGAGIWFIL